MLRANGPLLQTPYVTSCDRHMVLHCSVVELCLHLLAASINDIGIQWSALGGTEIMLPPKNERSDIESLAGQTCVAVDEAGAARALLLHLYWASSSSKVLTVVILKTLCSLQYLRGTKAYWKQHELLHSPSAKCIHLFNRLPFICA